ARSWRCWLCSRAVGCRNQVRLINKRHHSFLVLTAVQAAGAWLRERPPVAHAGGRFRLSNLVELGIAFGAHFLDQLIDFILGHADRFIADLDPTNAPSSHELFVESVAVGT